MTILKSMLMPHGARALLAMVLYGCLAAANCAYSQSRYSYSSDDSGPIVTDSKTGLVWQRCSQGQGWDGTICTGSGFFYTHEQALALAQTQTGWRLPNAKELFSLVERSGVGGKIDAAAFPGIYSDFWSSTPYVADPSKAIEVKFSGGYSYPQLRSQRLGVRLVR